jgi:hypothetical protein
MFGLFSKKKKDEPFIKIAVELLGMQMALCHDSPKFGDSFFRGYILGVCDALGQGAGIKEEAKMASFIVSVHSELFSDGEDMALKSLYKDQFEDQVFAKGRVLGGQEIIDCFKDDNLVPMGLANHCS